MNWHDQLWTVVKKLPSDFEPYGERSREADWGPDCSCGYRWFLPLEGALQYDWGVCANPVSPRRGLLTFEHMGCRQFEEDGWRVVIQIFGIPCLPSLGAPIKFPGAALPIEIAGAANGPSRRAASRHQLGIRR